MSIYSNVKCYKLRNEINTALNELNSYDANSLIGNIRNSSSLSYTTTPNCKSNITNAAKEICDSTSLKDGSINKLKNELINLKNATSYIERITELEIEIAELEKQLYDLEGNKNIDIENDINNKKQSIQYYESMI